MIQVENYRKKLTNSTTVAMCSNNTITVVYRQDQHNINIIFMSYQAHLGIFAIVMGQYVAILTTC